MEEKNVTASFWIGFLIAAVIAGLAYWYWRTQPWLPDPAVSLEAPGRAAMPSESQAGRSIEVEVRQKDKLERISGIGPVFARRLNEAGIFSFAELAALTPDELRERMGLEPWQGTPESWIEQAAALKS